MELHDLARMIAQEVLKQLRGSADKPRIVVLGEKNAQVAARIEGALGEDAEIFFSGEQMNDDASFSARHVLPFLSCEHMADLAAGRAADALSSSVLGLLLAGTEVEVLEFGYTRYSDTAPGPLLALYDSYKQTLASYGLKEFMRKQPELLRCRETLVTEDTVRKAKEQGVSTLVVPVSALVTPLAAETAATLQLTILKRL